MPCVTHLRWCVQQTHDIPSDLSIIYGIICRPNHIWGSYTGFKSYVDRGFKSYTDHFRPYMGVYMIIELNHIWSHIWYENKSYSNMPPNHMSNHIWFQNHIWFWFKSYMTEIKSYMEVHKIIYDLKSYMESYMVLKINHM